MLQIPLSNSALYHNVPFVLSSTVDLLSLVTQGVAGNQRIGDRIRLLRYQARMLLNNKSDRPNVTYRFVLVAVTYSSITDTPIELYMASQSNYLTGFIDSTQAMVVYDKIIAQPSAPVPFFPSGGTKYERSTFVEIDVPVNQNAIWSRNGIGALQRVMFIPFVVAFDAYGTLTTDNIASLQCDSQLTFSDA
jgi:hypothetical protein